MSSPDTNEPAPRQPLSEEDAHELQRLSAVVRLLDVLDEEELAGAIVREAMELSGAGFAMLFLAAAGEKEVALCGSTIPAYHALRRALEVSAGGGGKGPLDRKDAGTLTPAEVEDLFPNGAPAGFRDDSLACIPLVAEMFRAVLVIGREGGSVSPRMLASAAAFAGAVAPHLRTVQLLGRYRDLMIRDDQTRSFNRRYFDSFLEEEFIRATRYRSPLSVIFIDLDNLKNINENHGHAMGSEAIRQTADRLIPLIRAVDKLFRYGGDEFCVVLPETPWEGAQEVAERLRIAMEGASVLVEEIGGVHLTASFGVASYPAHAGSKQELVHRADEAMYSVKQAGKNAVAVAGDASDKRGGTS